MALDLSIVIPAWNTKDLLRDCLRSLESAQGGLSTEVIVVDNGSSDGTSALVRAEFPAVRLIRLEENRGYSGGMNAGLKEARGDLIALLNSDTVVHDGALSEMYEALLPLTDVGAACPRCVDAQGRLQSFGAKMMTATDYLRRIVEWPVIEPARDPDRSGYVDTPSGACLVLTRRGLEAIGSLDERLPLFLEEQDIARRLEAAGLRSFYVAEALVTHIGSQTVAQLDANAVWLATHRSYAHIYRKHFPWPVAAGLKTAGALSMLPRLVKSVLDMVAGRGGPRSEFGRARWRVKIQALRAYLRPSA